MTYFGPKWPLKSGNSDTFELYTDVKHQINYYIKNLLLTSPGENISDMSYGVGIRSYLFENNNDFTKSSVLSNISFQISKYISFIEIDDIDMISNSDDLDYGLSKIIIKYSIPDHTIQEVFELEIDPKTTIGYY